MNQRSHIQNSAKSSFTPFQTGFLQRKCASCRQHGAAEGTGDKCASAPATPSMGMSASRLNQDLSQIPAYRGASSTLPSTLKMGQPHDPHEQEADRVAEQVMRMPEPQLQHQTEAVGIGKTDIPTQPLVQRKTSIAAGSNGVPPVVNEVLRSPGKPLEPTTRAFMESRFDQDFSHVRIHTDAKAAKSAGALNAQAYTLGHNVVFGAGQYAPEKKREKSLLAHELAHVVQQGAAATTMPRIQRRVADNYAEIERRLTYRVFLDWVITDREAREVLGMLSGLSDRDLADTVTAMDRDGLLERLLNNVSAADKEQHAVLLGQINRYRSVSHSAERIIDRLSTGFFDWAVTDRDAQEALQALMGLDPQQLRTLVAHLVNKDLFDKLLDELPAEDHRRFAAFIERLRRIRDEFTALVTAHTEHLRSQPGGAGRTVRRTTQKTGYGGSRSTWSDLTPEQQRDWRERAAIAIANVIASVRGTELEAILARARLVFKPEETERLNAYAYVSGENALFFGRSWVRNAEDNPVNVWQSIAHELGGHEEFGRTWSWEIMRATLQRLTPQERQEALGSANSLFSAYGYLETEIYAELRELPFRIETSGGDRPERTSDQDKGDVNKQLNRIKKAFGPDVGRQIALRLYYRVMTDPRIAEAARRLLYNEIQAVFGLFPLSEPIQP
ncbi:MAG: DUF4157 domain-containing protein [Cyanobacteria bacterium P01_H01_bin.152]